MNIRKYNKIKDCFINAYQNKLLGLRDYYEKNSSSISINEFKLLNKKYREYIINMVKNLENIFKNIYNVDFCISLSGSLARNSNNLFSDIDINYLTMNNYYVEIIDIEDKINYILQEVLRFNGKDRIHSMVVYLPLIDDKKISAIEKNEYILNFDDGEIKVRCRNNAEQLMYETYNSTRNIYDVIDYFNKNDNEYLLEEWTYCFKFLYNSKYVELYKKYRREFRRDININKFINSLIKDIQSDTFYLDTNTQNIENCLLKKIYKSGVLFNFYKLLAIYYRIDNNVAKFELEGFFNESSMLDEKLLVLFNEYLKIIQDLQLILEKDNIDLSLHSSNLLDLNRINMIYANITKRNNIIDDLNCKKKELYNNCILRLRGIDNE